MFPWKKNLCCQSANATHTVSNFLCIKSRGSASCLRHLEKQHPVEAESQLQSRRCKKGTWLPANALLCPQLKFECGASSLGKLVTTKENSQSGSWTAFSDRCIILFWSNMESAELLGIKFTWYDIYIHMIMDFTGFSCTCKVVTLYCIWVWTPLHCNLASVGIEVTIGLDRTDHHPLHHAVMVAINQAAEQNLHQWPEQSQTRSASEPAGKSVRHITHINGEHA